MTPDVQEKFDALSDEQKQQIRHTAKHFKVSIFHAYLRAQLLGLLDDDRK